MRWCRKALCAEPGLTGAPYVLFPNVPGTRSLSVEIRASEKRSGLTKIAGARHCGSGWLPVYSAGTVSLCLGEGSSLFPPCYGVGGGQEKDPANRQRQIALSLETLWSQQRGRSSG